MRAYRDKVRLEEERMKIRKPRKVPSPLPEFNGHVEIFNLDSVKIKKLKELLDLQESRKKHHLAANAYKLAGETKEQAIIRKIEEMVKSTKHEFVNLRMEESGRSLCTRLAIQGDDLLLRRQLDSGEIYINTRDKCSGRTMLTEAVAGGHYTTARMLCREYGADPRVPSMLGNVTALHVAVQNGHRQLCALLLTHGANPNAQDKQGNTPLHYCTNILIIRLLGKFDVDPTIRNRRGLRASEYYRQKIPEDEQDPDLWAELFRRESQKAKEIAEYRAMKKKMREEVAQKAKEELAVRLVKEDRARRRQERKEVKANS